MYNPILDVFMMVVKKGSFSKAAQHLFLTHTAVIKQMNTLEEQLQTQLFYRSHQGISLTPAGQVLYDETKHIMSLSQQIILKVQEANLHLPVLIRVGVSTLYPCQPLMKIWEQISYHYPQFDIQMVPFTDDAHRLQLLGSQFDCLIGPYNALYKDAIYRFIPLGHYHFQIAINNRHPLAHNKIIHWQDLSHEKIMIMKTNYSPINDKIRQDLLTHCPHIEIMDIEPSYDTSTFNQCAKTQNLLLSLECWKDVHPLFIFHSIKIIRFLMELLQINQLVLNFKTFFKSFKIHHDMFLSSKNVDDNKDISNIFLCFHYEDIINPEKKKSLFFDDIEGKYKHSVIDGI